MGCAPSGEFIPPDSAPVIPQEFKVLDEDSVNISAPNYIENMDSRAGHNLQGGARGDLAAGAQNNRSRNSLKPDEPVLMKLLGKEKYIIEYKALVMDHRSEQGLLGTLIVFAEDVTEDIVFVYRDAASGSVFGKTYTDQELTEAKEMANIPFSWGSFFKSIAASILKSKVTIPPATGGQKREIVFTITSTKEPGLFLFRVATLLLTTGENGDPNVLHRFVLAPLSRLISTNRQRGFSNPKERDACRIECDLTYSSASVRKYKSSIDRLLPLIRPLREESAIRSHSAMSAGRAVRDMERTIRIQRECQIKKHPLDSLYEDGGAQYFQHVPWSVEHHPHEEEPDDTLSMCIREVFPLQPGKTLDSIQSVLDRPDMKKLVEFNDNRQVVNESLEIFKGIDRWDYDTIQLEIITNGNALYYTTYLLMYKLDLVRHFNIDDQVLRNFLVAVQSAYHPNPYHNAMHGADVTQINYFIMMVAGLAEKCQLSKEEIFAGLIAGAVHDFDHPGLNNNFHTRTNAYLATLYNDRSILENHHVACTFELLRHPRYNVLASLTDDQRLIVRETIVEMVLATDMGSHAKIFKQFQQRVEDPAPWHTKKEDIRLALSMSIKMADISNCARPNHIYAEWAKNISKEFYLQGDAERQLQLSISPFMDRTKEQQEFPKGQISFMMYIVQPMVELLAEFLPNLSFAVNLCKENKQYWTRLSAE